MQGTISDYHVSGCIADVCFLWGSTLRLYAPIHCGEYRLSHKLLTNQKCSEKYVCCVCLLKVSEQHLGLKKTNQPQKPWETLRAPVRVIVISMVTSRPPAAPDLGAIKETLQLGVDQTHSPFARVTLHRSKARGVFSCIPPSKQQ